MAKKYIVRLSSEERKQLEELVHKGKAAAYKRTHAQILLHADIGEEGSSGWKDSQISEALGVTTRTVERVRQRLVEHGIEAALNRAKQKNRRRKLDGEQEAKLLALACSTPPEGNARWTLNLLADRMVELKYVDDISHETVRKTLKKTK